MAFTTLSAASGMSSSTGTHSIWMVTQCNTLKTKHPVIIIILILTLTIIIIIITIILSILIIILTIITSMIVCVFTVFDSVFERRGDTLLVVV